MKPHFPPRGRQSLRAGRESLRDCLYLLTFCTHERELIFVNSALADIAARSLADAMLWRRNELYAWVLMPDHVHALIRLEGESLSTLMCRVKAVTSREVRESSGRVQATWMKGFHDRALREETDIAAAANYIAMNPVRAGLVESPQAYRWSWRLPE